MAITDEVIQLPGDSTGKKLDVSELTVGANTVYRERMTIASPESTGASSLAPVTSSGGLLITVSNPSTAVTVSNISTAVSLSSAIDISSGLVSVTSGTVTLSSTPLFNLVGTSSAPAVVTSSGGLEVTIVSGAGAGSSAVHIVGTSNGIAPVTTSGGLGVTILAGSGSGSTEVSLSSAIAISSGTVTLSSVHTVTATAATNPWSSAPSFNVPVLSASSGNIGTFPSTSRQMLPFTFNSSSSNSHTVVTTAAAILWGWNVGNQTTSGAASIKIYNSTAATVGSTTNLLNTIPIPGGSAGGGNNLILPQGVSYPSGLTFLITANFGATSTGARAAGDVVGTLYYNT
jgi:hypothetical protein